MQPLHDDDLILYVYGESPDADAIRDQADNDPYLRARIAALRADLERLSGATTPVPPADFEGQIWRRLAPQLEPHQPPWWRRLWAPRTALRPALALVAVLVLVTSAFLLGRTGRAPTDDTLTVASERILLTAVGEHLTRSQMLFLELANANLDRDAEIFRNRDLANANDLLSDNRFYRVAAAQAGHGQVVALLDAIERVLAELSNLPPGDATQPLASLRQRVTDQDLLFKVRILTDALDRQTQPPSIEPTARPGVSL